MKEAIRERKNTSNSRNPPPGFLTGYSSSIAVREGDVWKRRMQMSNVTP
jgi:hypothetical protein